LPPLTNVADLRLRPPVEPAADWYDLWQQYIDPNDPTLESKHVYDDDF
jgi:hypothetical protein